MADTKGSATTAKTSLTADDLLLGVDAPGGSAETINITALNAFSMLYGLGMVAVTTTDTATIGRMHYCTGTSYTITLPATSGNGGKLLGFVMAPIASLTGRVILDGNSSETIDGATTRTMWALETAVLLCDGSNWFKVAGKSIPMIGVMNITSDQAAIAENTVTAITLANTVIDNTAAMCDTSGHAITVKRTGSYVISHQIQATNATFAAGSRWQSRVDKNGSNILQVESNPTAFAGLYTTASQSVPGYALTLADAITLKAYQISGGAQSAHGAAGELDTFLAVMETPTW